MDIQIFREISLESVKTKLDEIIKKKCAPLLSG